MHFDGESVDAEGLIRASVLSGKPPSPLKGELLISKGAFCIYKLRATLVVTTNQKFPLQGVRGHEIRNKGNTRRAGARSNYRRYHDADIPNFYLLAKIAGG